MNLFFLTITASGTADATYYSGWDKVGAVAVCMLMLGVLVLLHRAGLKRVDQITDRHMAFMEKQTEVMAGLCDSNKSVVLGTSAFHKRLDWMLRCRKTGCPVNVMLSEDSEAEQKPMAGPQGPLP